VRVRNALLVSAYESSGGCEAFLNQMMADESSKKRSIRLVWGTAGLVLLLLFANALVFHIGPSFLRLLCVQSSVGGLIAMVITTRSALRSHRQFRTVDTVRILCWVLVGFGFGMAMDAGHFHQYYFPQYASAVALCGVGLAATAVVAIVMISVSVPAAPIPREGYCPQCGYYLRNLEVGRCPECGAGTRGQSPSSDQASDGTEMEERNDVG